MHPFGRLPARSTSAARLRSISHGDAYLVAAGTMNANTPFSHAPPLAASDVGGAVLCRCVCVTCLSFYRRLPSTARSTSAARPRSKRSKFTHSAYLIPGRAPRTQTHSFLTHPSGDCLLPQEVHRRPDAHLLRRAADGAGGRRQDLPQARGARLHRRA